MNNSVTKKEFQNIYGQIKNILLEARSKAYTAVNHEMVKTYWRIGQIIVEHEQEGKARAAYGISLLKELSESLKSEYGQGFDETNLRKMRQFYLIFEKRDTLSLKLSWSHYRLLMRIDNEKARTYYEQESMEQHWSVRALERQINTLYYERLLVSKNKNPVATEAEEKISRLKLSPEELIKNPYVMEFLNVKADSYLEKDLEQGLINKLQEFLLELGKGFSFVARQKRISTDHSEFYIDLVFYNYLLKCFLLIDLKTGKLTPQDIGQMDMYVRIFEDQVKPKEDNPTIGIILCTEKDEAVAKYSVLNESKQLFASKYLTYLPTEEELQKELLREKQLIETEKRLNEDI